MKATKAPSRRDFAHALAVLATATGGAAIADDKVIRPDDKTFFAALETVIRYRFGAHLTDDQLATVHASVVHGRGAGGILSRVKLDNSDDPFEAFRADGV